MKCKGRCTVQLSYLGWLPIAYSTKKEDILLDVMKKA